MGSHSEPYRSLRTPTTTTASLDIPSLGRITGLSFDGGDCTQYLGIKYAEVPGRFRKPQPAPEPWPGNAWDGTQLGPFCPQPPRDFYPVPSPPPRTWTNTPGTDELECLNLNISVPRHDPSAGPLPVMVFFHGGAYTYAAGNSPVYDGRLLATSSALDFGLPTIIVTLNYRLGVYGFLAGTDIQAFAAAHGEEGCGNYGVWDQVVALRWVQRHIAAFGGDPKRVCIFGQSAGSQSVACHLGRGEELFESCIMQSGVLGLCGIWTPAEYQVVFEKMLHELGISLDLGPIERVEALVAVPPELVSKAMAPVFQIPVITMALCDDGVFLPNISGLAKLQEFRVPDFAKRLMIGDAVHECIIWNAAWKHMSAADLLVQMQQFLGDKTELVAGLYNIRPDLSAKETFDAIERMTSDGCYRLANYVAELNVSSSYAYHFDVPSPYDNAWGGLCHHSFDNVLVWGILEHTVPQQQQQIGREMRKSWLQLANGVEPWEPFGGHGKTRVFGPTSTRTCTRDEYSKDAYAKWDTIISEGLVQPLAALSEELCLQRRAITRP